MNIRTILGVLLIALATFAFADDRESPASWSLDEPASVQLNRLFTVEYAALDLEALAFEDSLNEAAGEPPRFAFPRATRFNPHGDGNWDTSGDTSIWRMRVRAEEAVLLNFGFSNLFLPDGAALYIYTASAAEKRTMDRFQVIGPYTSSINREHGEFWTPNLHSDDVVIEVNVPTSQRDLVQFEISQVSHGYRAFGAATTDYWQQAGRLEGEGKQSCKDEGGQRSGACNMDVACLADDDPWNDPRRSVGAYQRDGVFACTGSLVNNTANDQRMLFITATHCITSGQAPSIVVYWNYEWPTCRTPGDPDGGQVNPPDPNVTNSGGTWLAATVNPFTGGGCTTPGDCSDVTLIELDDPADPDFELFWSGWDRRSTNATCGSLGGPGSTNGLCATIHHPGVDEKRITFVEQDIEPGNIAAAQGVHWHPFWHPDPPVVENIPEPQPSSIPPGVTEGGSSGSPLYTADQRFIGVLSGGPAFCGATGSQLSDFYGQLAHAWEGLGTPTTRMRDYLDPLETNPEFIDGIGTDSFEIVPEDTQIGQCGFDDLDIAIDVTQIGDFSDPVMLSATGLPAGVTDSFTNNNQAPPFATVLTLGNLAAAGEGGFTFAVDGEAGDQEFTVDIDVSLFDGAPAVPGLTSPSDGEMDVGLQPEFTWSAVSGAAEYQIQIATDAGFGTVVIDEFVTGTSFVPASELSTGTDYFWRVRGTNTCGDGDWSAEFSFTTRLEPVADVTPETFAFEVPQGGTDSNTLFVTNSGTGSLVWDIHESETAARGDGVLLEEDFEGAFPPDGWDTADNGSVSCPWLRSDSYPLPDLVASSLGAAIDSDECGVSGIPAESIDSELLAPALDLSGMAGTEISFDVAYRHFGSARMDFQVSGDGGDTWDTVETWNTDSTTATPVTFDLSAYDGLSDVRLRWHFVSGWDWWGFVDNVAVTTETVACDTPTDIAWLGASPDSGSTDAGMTDEVTVTVDAAGMEEGQYGANLCMTTNAEGQGLITLPVELTVTSVPAPVAAVSPESFDFEVMAGGADGGVLNVGNTGDADLEWSFTDSAPAECAWDTTLGNPGGSLNAMGLWGGTLYVGGSSSSNFNGVSGGVAEVDLDTATVTALGTTELVDGFVTSLLPYDHGNGERLYIVGAFNGIRFDGSELPDSRGVVAWDGSETVTLDGSPFAEPLVFAQAATVYDGQLVIGGAGGAVDPPQRPVLTFWDGTDWTVFREEFDGLVAPVILAVEEFGGDLYFGGRFATIDYPEGNLVESLNIMGFDGEDFFSVGGGLERNGSQVSHVLALKTFDDGSGEALYIGGTFDTSVDTQESLPSVAKWDGVELSPVGNGFPVGIQLRDFEVYDDGNGPALYAVGTFVEDTVGTPINRVAKLENGEWVEVAGGAGENPSRALSLSDGSLGFAGNFSDVGGASGVPGSGPSAGFAQLVCELEVVCDDISQIPWLDVAPDAGITTPGGSEPVDILVDTDGLGAGDYEALLCLATNDPAASIVEVPVMLTVIPEPGELEVSPESVGFGGVAVGGTGAAVVTVSNAAEAGSADLDLSQIEIIAGQDVFAIDAAGSDCGETLAPQTSCTVALNYSPDAVTTHNGVLRIVAEGKGTVNVNLSGNGVEAGSTIFEDRFEME